MATKNPSVKAILDTAIDRDRKRDSEPRLEPESCLITHGNAIEHVARRRGGLVSVGALIRVAKRPSAKNARGRNGRSQGPISIGVDRRSKRGWIMRRDISGLRRL